MQFHFQSIGVTRDKNVWSMAIKNEKGIVIDISVMQWEGWKDVWHDERVLYK